MTTTLITGATRGVGLELSRRLREAGHTVYLGARNLDRGRAAAAEIDARAIALDVTDATSVRAAVDQLQQEVGSLDVLVNNAGVYLPTPLDDAAAWDAGWEANLRVNLLAPATLCRLAVQSWRGTGGGVVVNVTSRSAHRGDDGDHLAYGAAKGGLQALTKGVARAFAADRVLAYDVAPGWVLTEMVAGSPEVVARASSLPMGEITPAEDVAEVVAFLASGRSPHTTGATIDVTGADYVR